MIVWGETAGRRMGREEVLGMNVYVTVSWKVKIIIKE